MFSILTIVYLLYYFQSVATYPKVYILLEGYQKLDQMGSVHMSGSVTLVTVEDEAIVVDTGTSNQAYSIMNILDEQHGINASDVSMLIITHTHPDHYQNALLFHPATQIVYKQEVNEDEFKDTPLVSSPVWSPLGMADLILFSTPGHTATDVSLIVLNFNNTGESLAIVGDLFLDANDEDRAGDGMGRARWTARSLYPRIQRIYRQVIGCQVDYILPGHGPIFRVSQEMKNITLDCYSGQQTMTVSPIALLLGLIHAGLKLM